MLSGFSRVRLFATPWAVARQAPLVHGILQARMCVWVAMPSSRGSSPPGIKPASPALEADSLPLVPLVSLSSEYFSSIYTIRKKFQEKL